MDMDIEALRSRTPGCANRLHLNNAGAGLLSRRTLSAVVGHLELEAAIGGYEAADRKSQEVGAVYEGLARLIGGRPDEIALFDNATRAWNAAFYAVPFGPGDRILTGRSEYGSNILAYLQVARRRGAEVVVVPNDEYGQLDTAELARMIDERTRLVGVSHVPTSGGLVNPVAEIGRVTRAAGVPFLLDATQSIGQFPVDAGAIGADMVAGTGRKFLRGPRGTGFLWVRTGMLAGLEPSVVEIESGVWDGGRGFTWAQGARRFATWEKSYANVLGLGAAVDEALALGMEAVGERVFALGASLRERLAALPGVTTYDLGRERCAIVTAKAEGVAAERIAQVLRAGGVNVSTTHPESSQFDNEDRGVHPLVRLSPHYYNTEEELDTAVRLFATAAAEGR